MAAGRHRAVAGRGWRCLPRYRAVGAMSTLVVPVGGSIQAAIDAAAPGDTIDVTAGDYLDQFLTVEKNITLQATGGMVVLTEDAQPPNGKAMITEGQPGLTVAINGCAISGVTVPDNNGAAVRYEGGALSLSNDYFHSDQDGLLGAPDPNGSISIDHSEFAFNGDGSGSTHNIYIGAIADFSITNSYVHDANVGHEIKSRAANNTITNDRIFDNASTASYSIDLPNGGDATITNNVIEQGPNSQNPAIIAYGEEGHSNPGATVVMTGDTLHRQRSRRRHLPARSGRHPGRAHRRCRVRLDRTRHHDPGHTPHARSRPDRLHHTISELTASRRHHPYSRRHPKASWRRASLSRGFPR